MKKLYQNIIITFLAVGCSTSGKEESNELPLNKGVHFTSGHGTTNIPVSVVKKNEMYHLFYTTGSDEWGQAVSTNMLHWKISNAVDVPTEETGDVVLDKVKSEGAAPNWVIFYSDDIIKAISSPDQKNWKDYELIFDQSGIEGIPKINQNIASDNWTMTVTNEDQIIFLHSDNLKEWKTYNSIENQHEIEYCELVFAKEIPFLIINGYSGHVRLKFEDRKFQISENQHITNSSKTKGTLFNIEDVTYVISSISGKTLSIPLMVELKETGEKLHYKPDILKKESTGRKRGRLSGLIGAETSWYNFKLDSLRGQYKLLLSNGNKEEAAIEIAEVDGSITVKTEGVRGESEFSGKLSEASGIELDIVIDYNVIEIFINKGEIHFANYLKSWSVLNSIKVISNNKEIDPRAMVYGISQAPNQQL
ncbi:MAG: GH32 C-terminal domain-containing protein [Ekhidna sp.]|nr:GH32 C-terminal domain-containing protein [Ekhidna sp.]